MGEHLPETSAEVLGAPGFPEDASDWPAAKLPSGEKQRLELAVKYQILITFAAAVAICARRLFDGRERLRLDRLTT